MQAEILGCLHKFLGAPVGIFQKIGYLQNLMKFTTIITNQSDV